MQKPELTPRQQKILDFIREQITNLQRSPTVREIGKHFDIKSPNGVMCHLRALERKRYIVIDKGISRGIRLVDQPQFEIDWREKTETGKEYVICTQSGFIVGTIRRVS